MRTNGPQQRTRVVASERLGGGSAFFDVPKKRCITGECGGAGWDELWCGAGGEEDDARRRRRRRSFARSFVRSLPPRRRLSASVRA